MDVELILTTLTLIVLVVCLIYGFMQFYQAIKNMFAITKEYKPGINPWGLQTFFNPFNGLVFTNLLTTKGKEHVRLYWQSMGKFVVAIIIPFAVAFLTEFITGIQLVQR